MRQTHRLATLALLSSSRVSTSFPSWKICCLWNGHKVKASRMSVTSYASKQDDDALVSSKDFVLFHLSTTVDSTQDETKRILTEIGCYESRLLAVIADDQTKGRGTGGRSWVAKRGNLFLTCAIPAEAIPIPQITLLPLGVGVLIAEQLAKYARMQPMVKWPNDVLLNDHKIAGTLIENHRVREQSWWLVGIGVNLESHPEQLSNDEEGLTKHIRSATCLRDHAVIEAEIPTAVELGVCLTSALVQLTKNLQTENYSSIVPSWKSWATMGTTYVIRKTGEEVRTVDIENDGQLRVIGRDGKERLLVADYFY